MRTLSVVSPPAAEPLTLDEVKDWAKIDGGEDDALINDLIVTAREAAEEYTRRAFITQTIRLTLDLGCGLNDTLGDGIYDLPMSVLFGALPRTIELPREPIQSIQSVITYSLADAPSAFAPSNYRLSGPRLILTYGAAWPSGIRPEAACEITYLAGYGDAADSVPRAIRTGMLMHIQAMHDGRMICDLPDSCVKLYQPYRLLRA